MEMNEPNSTFLISDVHFNIAVNSSSELMTANINETISTSFPILYNASFSWREVNIGIPHLAPDWTPYDWNGSQYPSGYSQVRIILTAFFVTFIMVVIVVGNMLVCIAIATEKALKTVQNWFIASLAVSDFLLGLVIMPFSLAKELMGYWIFGNLWCEIHAALDVLLCTASINNLCLISLDRYWSVTQAVEYLKKRTPTRAVLMIFFVWLLSALISLPPLLGWKKGEKPENYPSCSLSDDVGYVVYSALGSFYVPAIVMVFVYIRIFIAARSRARRHVKKTRYASEVTNDPPRDKSTTTTTCTSFSNTSPPDKRRDPDLYRFQEQAKLNGGKRESPVTPTIPIMPQIIIEASQEFDLTPPQFFPSDIAAIHPYEREEIPEEQEDDDDDDEEEEEDEEREKDCNRTSDPESKEDVSLGDSNQSPTLQVSVVSTEARSPCLSLCSHRPLRRLSSKRTTFEEDTQHSSANALNVRDSESSKLYTSPNYSSLPTPKSGKFRSRLPLRYHAPLIGTPSDAERQKRRLAKARERRATLILGLIMAAFILAWLPFFVLYVLEALCDSCDIGTTGFAIAFWLGYCNSALNPIIYTIFNRDFRRAFKKILLK